MHSLLKFNINNKLFNYTLNIKKDLLSDAHLLFDTLSNDQKDAIKKYPNKRINIILKEAKMVKSFLSCTFNSFFPESKYTVYDIEMITKELLNYSELTLEQFIKTDFSSKVNNLIKKLECNIINEFDYVVIGCPDSTDIDIIIIVDGKYDVNTVEINIDLLKEKLKKIGKDISKELDINIVHIEGKRVTCSKKGSIKTIQGIIYYTQNLHMPNDKLIDINRPDSFIINDRIAPVINYIISKFKCFMTDDQYIQLYDDINNAKNGNIYDKVLYIVNKNILDIIMNNLEPLFVTDIIFTDCIKALFVKMSTVLLINNNMMDTVDYYTKKGLAKLLNILYIDTYEYSLYYLFRGLEGNMDINFFKKIMYDFFELVHQYIKQMDFKWITNEILDINKPINHLNIHMQTLFWQNPIKPSDEFIKLFKSICPDGLIENHFLIPSCSEKDIINFPILLKKSILVAQRSKKWFDLRKIFLPKGRTEVRNDYANYKFTVSWVTDLFHLIVGSMAEQYIMYNIDWSKLFPGYKFVNVGLIVNQETSESISPDGLLINDITKDIIPVEIKCLRCPKNIYSKASIRELVLAKEQLKTMKSMIEDIKNGLLAFLYLNKNEDDVVKIEFEYAVINL